MDYLSHQKNKWRASREYAGGPIVPFRSVTKMAYPTKGMLRLQIRNIKVQRDKAGRRTSPFLGNASAELDIQSVVCCLCVVADVVVADT